MSCKCKSCKCNNGESHSIPLQLQLQLTGFDEKNDMTDKQPDLWFSFVRAHRAMIRKIEAKLSEAGLPVYAWYDVGIGKRGKRHAACMSWRTCW